MGVEAGLITV